MIGTSRQIPCSFSVNRSQFDLAVSPDETLLHTLRDRLGLRGTKKNCEQGECGACTVLFDGVSVNSCLVLAGSAHGHSITTIEGLGQDGGMDPLQEAFLAADASQCGFCTPGFVMAAKGLLNENPEPTPEDVRAALAGNYCRCTGYKGAVEAICLKEVRPEATEPWLHSRNHVAGETIYLDDMTVPDMLHGSLVTLPVARAAIESIDVSDAVGMAGVVRIFTAADFAANGVPRFGPLVADQPILASNHTTFEGQPVAFVAAETEELARAAAKKVRVTYKELPALLTSDQARSDDLIHDPESRVAAQSRWAHSNVMQEWAFDWGEADLARIEDAADVVIEDTYEAPFVHHFFMEPLATICVPQDGGVTVLSTTQHPFVLRRVIATMLGLDPEQVRVKVLDLGGGFGGKGYPKIEPLTAVCSLELKRPIKVALTAGESFLWAQREASRIRMRTGFTRDGGLLFQDIDADFLVGAYTDISPAVISKTTLYALGPYRTPRARVRSRGLFTNTGPATAFRGFGATHMNMALECQMNAAAQALGMDPVDLRLKNARARGEEITAFDTPVDGDWSELLRRVAAEAGWDRAKPDGRGRGIAFGMKANSSSRSEARVHLSQDGSAVAYAGTSEMGQGQRDNLRSLLAEFLQVPVEKTAVVMTDTGVVPFDSWTASSRSTVMMGNAVRAACDDVRSQLAQFARDHVGGGADEVIFRDGNVCVASQEIPMTQLLHVYSADGVTGNGTFATATNPAHPLGGAAPFFQVVATAVELHIDRDTGQVILDKVVHGGDAGKVINRRRAARIDEGGLMMGQSLTLSEELVFGASGELRNGSSLDYRIATVADLPAEMISGIYVENADGPGPFGAKGLAEGAILAIGPAICGAILDLTGVHVTRIPLTPERLWRALSEQAQRTAPAGAIPV